MCSGAKVSEAHKPRQAGGRARASGEGEMKGGGGGGGDGGVGGVRGCRVELGGRIREGGGDVFWGGAEMPPG